MYFHMNNPKMLPLTKVSIRIKFFRINLTKVAEDLHSENYNISLKKGKEDLNK